MWTVLQEVISSDTLSYTVSAADEMYLVNIRTANAYSHGIVVRTTAHVATEVLKVEDEVYADYCSGVTVPFLLGMMQKVQLCQQTPEDCIK